MVGIYFSGTGNTKHCVQEFLKNCKSNAKAFAIEDENAIKAIRDNEVIILGYPIYFSNLPTIMRDFLNNNKEIFKGKNIYIIATMGLFSGDGTGCSARLLKMYGAKILGGLHLKMPDCIGDEKLLKKTLEQNLSLIKQADNKIFKAAKEFNNGNPTREGLSFWYHMAGLFGQRLWFYNKTKNYSNKVKIDSKKCITCGLCVKMCPMQNLEMKEAKVEQKGKCTLCYRCFSNCSTQAITLLGETVHEQCKFENYSKIEEKENN